jgi:hypothetical protein
MDMKKKDTKAEVAAEPKAYQAPKVRDNGGVARLTKDHPAFGNPEMFDYTLVWGN